MGRTQAQLTENTREALFSLDFLFYAVTIVAGCDAFCPTLCAANQIHWLQQLPLAVDLISRNTYWKDDIVRVRNANSKTNIMQIYDGKVLQSFFQIFEFLYHLTTQQTDLAKEYETIACQALICTKSHEYFLRKLTWMKFIDLQK